ncbi:MAG: tetratricopeptide repeat protein [Candidatus Cryosericum sp.]
MATAMTYAAAMVSDWFGAKHAAMSLFARSPRSDYAAWWGAVGLMQRGKEEEALGLLMRVHAMHTDWKRTKRLLATLYLRRDAGKAVQLYSPPTGIWEELTLGDLLYFFVHHEDEGIRWWRQAYTKVDWSTARELDNPARLLLKRLCRVTDDPELLEQFVELDTDNVRQRDIVDYANILASRGELDKAREMLDRGLYIYRGDPELTACWARLGFGQLPAYRVKSSGTPAVRHNVYTGLLTEATDLAAIVDKVHEEYPTGIITIASSVMTMCEGTLLWIDTFKPSRLARLLGPYTGHGNGVFVHWYSYPNEAAWKVQAYIELAGTFRVVLGTAATLLGRLLHHKGWFYAVVGSVAKAVDSDKVMPYDACLVPGPLDVQRSIAVLAAKGARISVVDVNDVTGAEVVASTEGIDEDWLRRSLEDNPAGNDDSMTPIVVVMPQ